MPIPKNKLNESIDEHGIFFRNPTHVEEANFSTSQGGLVKALVGSKHPRSKKILQYNEEDKPWSLSGFKKIRTLSTDNINGLFNSLMRYRPNIYSVHIVLGDYQNQKPLNSTKVQLLQLTEPRFASEIAQKLADVFTDQSYHVTELLFTINNAETGNFNTSCEAFYVEKEEYENDDLFNPAVKIEFWTND